jgi:hypothetical protein
MSPCVFVVCAQTLLLRCQPIKVDLERAKERRSSLVRENSLLIGEM